jgi:putative ABC transport system permease protein
LHRYWRHFVKYFSLIWAGLRRRPTRLVFTGLSIATAFVLFGMLEGLNAGFAKALEDQDLNGLMTDMKIPGGEGIPISAMTKIERIPGVTVVAPRFYFIGAYQQPKNLVAALATEPRRWFALRPTFTVSRAHLAALATTPTGMLATPGLMRFYGWKIGDRIPLTSSIPKTDGTNVWTFDLLGTFDTRSDPGKATLALINYDYLDAARATEKGTVDRYLVRIADPTRSVAVSKAIDGMFANSAHETRTRSEKEFAQSQMKQIGDVKLLTNAVVGAVLFTLLFLTANVMKYSVHERISEFAVLKTIGFANSQVAALVLSEALLLCVICAALGLALSTLAAPFMVNVLGKVRVSWTVVADAGVIAVLMAIISAAPPAWRMHRLRIIEALAVR